jgi:hypothetical protein
MDHKNDCDLFTYVWKYTTHHKRSHRIQSDSLAVIKTTPFRKKFLLPSSGEKNLTCLAPPGEPTN